MILEAPPSNWGLAKSPKVVINSRKQPEIISVRACGMVIFKKAIIGFALDDVAVLESLVVETIAR